MGKQVLRQMLLTAGSIQVGGEKECAVFSPAKRHTHTHTNHIVKSMQSASLPLRQYGLILI